MKHESASRPKHAAEHAPTVIHDYGADETLLARWLRRAMAKGAPFWLMAAGVVVLAMALLFLVSSLSVRDPAKSVAWDELAQAKDADAQIKVAEEYPKSPAAPWARLQAAGVRFSEGVEKLATDRTSALPLLKQALDQYQDVARDAPKDSPLARLATLGVARSLEARNELKEAIEQYRAVAERWPGTDEARLAERQAEALQQPENVEFYKQLYAYKPPERTIPPGGKGIFDNLLPPGHPPLEGPLPTLPGSSSLPNPTGPIRVPASPTTDDPLPPPLDPPSETPRPAGDLPSDPFTPHN